MLRGTLSWIFSGLPIHLIPTPFQPFLMSVQGLYPFLGPISFFISWGWSWIMSYDIGELVLFKFSFLSVIDRISNEGYGVTLTATWILPVDPWDLARHRFSKISNSQLSYPTSTIPSVIV